MIYVKIHKHKYGGVIAICDKNLIGKKVSDKNLQLNITERFYKGEIFNDEDIIEILKEVSNANIVGKKAVELALKNKIIKKRDVIMVKNVPHALIFSI